MSASQLWWIRRSEKERERGENLTLLTKLKKTQLVCEVHRWYWILDMVEISYAVVKIEPTARAT